MEDKNVVLAQLRARSMMGFHKVHAGTSEMRDSACSYFSLPHMNRRNQITAVECIKSAKK